MFRLNADPILDIFGKRSPETVFFVCFSSDPLTLLNYCFVSQCSCYNLGTRGPTARRSSHPPPSPLDTPPTSSPHVCPCIWEVKHVCDITRTTRNADGMEWRQPQPGRAPRLMGRERKRGRKEGGGRVRWEGEQQAGMKVRKPSLVEEPTKPKMGR